MISVLIYLDESGDLGWSFDKPYRHGGSSRYLTIASLVVDPSKKHFPKRLIKKLYTKFKEMISAIKLYSFKPPAALCCSAGATL
jgi:hypothetical protein